MILNAHEILSFLKDRCYPFSLISESRIEEAADAVRLIEIAQGATLSKGNDDSDVCVFVISGGLALATAEGTYRDVRAEDTHCRPLYIPYLSPATTIQASEDSVVCLVDSETLDYLLFWDEASRSFDPYDAETRHRMEIVRRSVAFRRLPPAQVWEMFRRMEPMAVKKGDEVVRQGEKGDAYYLITAGRAEVWECGLYDDTPVKVNEIKAGDAFGEHALLVGGSRSATVRMVEEGSMLVLREADFQSLISAPMLNEVAPDMAKALIDAGYEALDVRYREERDESYIPGSFLIPLHELRHRFSEFRTGNKYLVYCQSGKRAAVATLLLNQHHFDAVSLRGGLRDWPYEVQRAD